MYSLQGNFKSNQGLTLIEICIAMTVLGVILAGALQQLNAYQKMKARDDTSASLNNLEAALNEFFYQNNRHPCPALINLPRNSPNYGVEGSHCTSGAVVTGMVPFKTLNIPENFAYDGWHNRITYTVTRSLTTAPVLLTSGGAVEVTQIVYDEGTGVTSYSAPAMAQYVLVSHGDNGVGAYNEAGVVSQVCVSPSTPVNAERTNCDANASYTAAPSRYFVNYSNTVDYFDDMVLAVTIVPARIWMNSRVNRKDIYTQTSLIGIGTEAPDDSVNLDVAGNIRSKNLLANVVCENQDPSRCFQPEMIAGDLPTMECVGGVMIGIADGKAICEALGFERGPSRSCPPGTYGVGFDNTGEMLCE